MPGWIEVSAGKSRMVGAVAVSTKHQVHSPTQAGIVEKEGVKLLIDPMSIQYLTGAEIDYSEGLEGAQFVIRNPNAQTTCGCGSSFSV